MSDMINDEFRRLFSDTLSSIPKIGENVAGLREQVKNLQAAVDRVSDRDISTLQKQVSGLADKVDTLEREVHQMDKSAQEELARRAMELERRALAEVTTLRGDVNVAREQLRQDLAEARIDALKRGSVIGLGSAGGVVSLVEVIKLLIERGS